MSSSKVARCVSCSVRYVYDDDGDEEKLVSGKLIKTYKPHSTKRVILIKDEGSRDFQEYLKVNVSWSDGSARALTFSFSNEGAGADSIRGH